MTTILYCFQSALKSIWREKWINMLTTLSISIGLLILCIFAVITINMDSALQRWSKNFGMVVYLDDTIDKQRQDEINSYFLRDKDIAEVNFISKEQALNEVKKALGNNAIILDDFEENPLPASFELKLKDGLLEPALVKRKADEMAKIEGIEEVQYGEKWLSSLYAISKTIKFGAILFGCAIFIAITFITYCTIKIFFHRKSEEIETLKLLGATKVFTKLPFLIEGLVIGAIGGIISTLAIYGAYIFTTTKVVQFLPSIKMMTSSMPLEVYIIIPIAGALMSTLGSFIAVGKIRY
jgi:cell division transport system permease protein